MYPSEEISEALLRDLINDSWNLVVDGLAKRDQKSASVLKRKSIAHFLAYHFSLNLVICWHAKLLSHGVFMDIIYVALKRHSTKAFDASKNLPRNRPSRSKLSCNTAHPAPTPSRGILLLPARKKVKRVLPNPLPVITCSTNVKYLMPRTSWCSVQNRDGRCTAEAGC